VTDVAGRARSTAEPAAITDEGIARLRARVGVAEPHPLPPHYLRPGTDAFRHVAIAYGDDNPLWCDPAYGPGTRWGSPIAPPPLVGGDTLIGEDEVAELAPDQRDLMKGDPLRGVHAFYSASAREWWAPLVPDRRTGRADIGAGVEERRRAGVQGPGSHTLHVITTMRVEIDGDVATAHSYWQYYADTATDPVLRGVGQYHDTIRRTPEGWKVARRTVVTG